MPCQVSLRHDQTAKQMTPSGNEGVWIYAPKWMEAGLVNLGSQLQGTVFMVHSPNKSDGDNTLLDFTIDKNVSLGQLQMIARNEPINTTGIIDMTMYKPDVKDDAVIYSLKDLVRHSVVVGLDQTTHFCGMGSEGRTSQHDPVYICDLAGLQFQQAYNSGRLVLVQERPKHAGLLDNFIFRHVVGEPMKTYAEVNNDPNAKGRYVRHYCHIFGNAYFDVMAYRKFVALDVVLSGIALNDAACYNSHEINFKFLKYGTGFFGATLRNLLSKHILAGVVDGLEVLFDQCPHSTRAIKFVELPFYIPDDDSIRRLEALQSRHDFRYKLSKDDALKSTMKDEGLVTACTNCGDPHVVAGNEMGFASVDAAIAENLKSKATIFSSCLNQKIKEKFVNI